MFDGEALDEMGTNDAFERQWEMMRSDSDGASDKIDVKDSDLSSKTSLEAENCDLRSKLNAAEHEIKLLRTRIAILEGGVGEDTK